MEDDFPRDLADLPGPSADSLERDADVLRALALSHEQVEKFNRDGFVATERPVFTTSQLDWLRRDLDRLTCQDPPHPKVDLLHELHYNEAKGSGQILFHCLGHWRVAHSFHDLLYNDAIGLPATQLLRGQKVRFWHDQAFVKPGRDGACVQWHQDMSYWDRTGPMAHLTAHIALDDQTLENGALHWVPGSHRWTRDGGPLPQAATIAREKMEKAKAAGGGDDLDAASFTTEMDALHDNVLNADERAQWAARPPETVLLKAGHVAFHHALTVHGSFGNRSDHPRRALVLNFFADGTKALMDGTLLKGAPAVAKGETLGGKFHPLVFDASRVDMASLPVASV